MKHKVFYIASIALLFFNAAGALYGGWSLMADPSGRSIQMPMEVLRDTFFTDFLFPGIILFLLIGVISSIAFVATLLKWKYYSRLIFLEGMLLFGWIIIQYTWTAFYNPLQLVMAIVGLLLLWCGYNLNKSKSYA